MAQSSTLTRKVPEMLDRDIDRIEITVDQCIKDDLCNKRNAALRRSLRSEKPAYVKRLADKAEAQRRVPAERQASELRRMRRPNQKLAADITSYVDRNGGEIMGVSLAVIHAEFAQMLLDDVSDNSLKLIRCAMQYAIGKGWLEEREAGCILVVPAA